MSEILASLNAYLPEGWTVTHLISLGQDWKVIATDDEHIASATRETIEAALAQTTINIFNEVFVGRLFSNLQPAAPPVNLLAMLGLGKRAEIKRRI